MNVMIETKSDEDSARAMIQNPFPGPQPFRATDRAHFYGREDLSHRLEGSILAHRAVVVFGPSGSGKSSLIQASVLPNLRDSEDVRLVHLDGWPPGEDPTLWLAAAMYSELKQGPLPTELSPNEAVLSSLKRAVRGSSRMLVISIDQLEQLLYSDRDPRKTENFFDCVNQILDLPLRTLRVVMSLREDYLGIFRDRLRDHRRVLGQGFRVGPLTVAELTASMCKMAESGTPGQTWDFDAIRALMMQVRVPGQAESDDAEAQAAYGQIVCRALFQQRTEGQTNFDKVLQAEPILQNYLETTLTSLGNLRERAEQLLAEHLVSGDGGRTLRTEKELQRHFSAADLQTILGALEGSAILHAASHQGSRYFEIGHDWLARKVFEKRQVREQEEQRRKYEKEQAEALEKARREKRLYAAITIVALGGIVLSVFAYLKIRFEKEKADQAKAEADRAALVARRKEIDAHDAGILAGVRELSSRGKLTWAMKLLPEVEMPVYRRGWVALASDLLEGNVLLSTLEGHTGSLTNASFSPDGNYVLTSSVDGTARIWDVAGKTPPIVLSGHTEALVLASWSHDGKSVLTASFDGTARIFDVFGHAEPIVLSGDDAPLTYAEFSPDDARVVTASQNGFVRIHSREKKTAIAEVRPSKRAIHCARFHPDGVRVFLGTQDESVLVWNGKPKMKPTEIGKHEGSVVFLALSADGNRLLSASVDGAAILWDIHGKTPRIVTTIDHDGPVHHAAFSADGKFVATASSDRTAHVFRVDGNEPPIVLSGHTQAVTHVAFDRTGEFLATASQDATARIFRIQGGVSLVLRGHDAAVHSIAWKNDGSAVVTAAGDGTDRSPDETAKIWRSDSMQHLGLGSLGPKAFHAADGNLSSQYLVTVHSDGALRILNQGHSEKPVVVPGPGSWVANVSTSPDGKNVATAAFDGNIRKYSLEKPSEPVILGRHKAEARFAIFSPGGKRILSGGDDKRAVIWDADGKNPPVEFEGHEDWLTAGAWSADGKQIVTASFDHTARIWNSDGQGEPRKLVGHDAEVLAVAFFPDSQRVATASADHTARIWTPGKAPIVLQHEAAVTHVAVSADNELIATYAADHLIRIWWVGTVAPPIELESAASVRLMAFDPKGWALLVLDEEGTLRRWSVDVAALRKSIMSANAECLPPSIRVLYLSESLATAEERFGLCKRNPNEMPWFVNLGTDMIVEGIDYGASIETPPRTVTIPTLSSLGSDYIRNKVVVLPADADVEVNGVLTPRRQGVIEFTGKIGQTRTLLVQRGAKHRAFEVTIGAGSAVPPMVDLNDKLQPVVRPGVKDKPAVTENNPTLPNTMQ